MPRGLILAIESSCDETAAAVVQQGSHTLSSVVASQISTHARYGGVVPELASREHLRAIVPVVRAALAEAHASLADLDAIAVTNGPGLAGALLVGITYAKALAFATGLPLIAVNHLEGHIHAVLLNERESAASMQGTGRSPASPLDAQSALALVVSGGHTHLYLVRPLDNTWHYTLVGRTLDDAAGEAYDKVAKLLGLGYPGGPWIDALALHGNPRAVPFAFSHIKTKAHLGGAAPRTKAARTSPIASLDPQFLFSFSGIRPPFCATSTSTISAPRPSPAATPSSPDPTHQVLPKFRVPHVSHLRHGAPPSRKGPRAAAPPSKTLSSTPNRKPSTSSPASNTPSSATS